MPPAAVGLGLAGGAIFGGAKVLSKGMGTGRNDARATDFKNSGEYDPNAFQYGGHPGGADAAAGAASGTGDVYKQGSFDAFNSGRAEMGGADTALGKEGSAADLIMARAQGRDLISSRLAQLQRQRLGESMASDEASARGPGGVALAGANRAAAEAQGLSGIGAQETVAGMQEQSDAEKAAVGAYGNIAGGYTNAAGTNYAGSQGQGGLGLGYSNLSNDIQKAQMSGQIEGQKTLAGSQGQTQQTNVGVEQNNANNQWNLPKMLLGGAGTAGGIGVEAAKASDPLAKIEIVPIGRNLAALNGPEKLSPGGGGEDVAATIEAMAAQPKQGQMSSPLSGGIAGPMMPVASDPAAKAQVFEMGRQRGHAEAKTSSMSDGEAPQYPQERTVAHFLKPDERKFLTDPYEGQPVTPRNFIPPAIKRHMPPPPQQAAPEQPPEIKFPRRAETAGAHLEAAKPLEGTSKSVMIDGQRFVLPAPAPEPERPVVTPSGRTAREVEDADYPPLPRPSDPRAKALGGVHDDEVAKTLDETPAVSYKYRDAHFEPEAQRPGERQAGFLTTDLKKTPLGAAVVEERPDGLEGYNEHRMMGLEWAGLQNVHERLRDLEAELAMHRKKAR